MGNDRKPMLLVFAGPNGSGKSSISDLFEIVGEYTNADEIVRAAGISNIDAARMVDEKRYAAINDKRDFTFETVLSSEYKMDILRKAKANGYFLKGVFVLTITPEINKIRVAARVENGGHDVAEDKIESRYYKSLANVPELMELCDILHVYDNSGDFLQRIVRKHKDSVSIFPNEFWEEENILKLIGANESQPE